jgi:hypothetical protein
VSSKAHLLYHIFDRALSRAVFRLEEISARYEDPVERLALMVAHQVSIVAEERSMFSVFFGARPRLDEQYEERIRSLERRYIRFYVEAVQAVMDIGVIPRGNAHHTAQGILGMSNWIYTWFDPETDTWTSVCGDFLRLILPSAGVRELPSSADLMHRLGALDAKPTARAAGQA